MNESRHCESFVAVTEGEGRGRRQMGGAGGSTGRLVFTRKKEKQKNKDGR